MCLPLRVYKAKDLCSRSKCSKDSGQQVIVMEWTVMVTHKMLTKCMGSGTDMEHKPRSWTVRQSKHWESTVGPRDVCNVKVGSSSNSREGEFEQMPPS